MTTIQINDSWLQARTFGNVFSPSVSPTLRPTNRNFVVADSNSTFAILGSASAGLLDSDSIGRWVDSAFRRERSLLDGADLLLDVLNVGVARRTVKVHVVAQRALGAEAGLTEAEWHELAQDFDDDLV